MPSIYVDRGIIKWSAFDALNGYNQMLKELRQRLGKKPKPILSDDDFETLNRRLEEAAINKYEIELIYYENGYLKNTYGKIKKLDYNNKLLILTTLEKISALDVLSIIYLIIVNICVII